MEAEIEPLPGGNRNCVFRTLGLHRDLVFKTTNRESAAIEWLVPVLDLAEQSGFIVPSPIKSKNGRYVEQGWTCEPFLTGKMFRAGELSCIDQQLLRFQKASAHVPQRPGFLSALALIEAEFGGDVDFRSMPADVVTLCRAAWSQISVEPKSVVHGDLNTSNLIWAESGVALLDWDEARVDAGFFDGYHAGLAGAAYELPVLAWEVACSWQREPDYARRLAVKLEQMATP